MTYHQVRALFGLLVLTVFFGGAAISEFKRGDQAMAVRFTVGSVFTAIVFIFALVYWLKNPPTKKRRRV
jgi:predicted membrane protein